MFHESKTKAAILLVSIVLSLTVAEIAARMLTCITAPWWSCSGIQLYPLDGETLNTVPGQNIVPGYPSVWSWSKYTHHMPTPSWKGFRSVSDEDRKDGIENIWLEYNTLGMRGPEIKEKTLPRILLLGDSFIEAEELDLADTAGEVLNRRVRHLRIEVLQQGFSSWSPITEFAWVLHFGSGLAIDRIYLFVVDNDFFSPMVYPKVDAQYRKMFSFDERGYPLVIRELEPKFPFFLQEIRLLRLLESAAAGFRRGVGGKLTSLGRFWQETVPFREKLFRLYARVRYGKPLIKLTTDLLSKIEQYVVKDKFAWDNRQPIERLMIRLPTEEWDDLVKSSVQSTIKSITSFRNYMWTQGKELIVVYVPLGVDIDAHESIGAREEMGLREGIFFKESGLETYLENELRLLGVTFMNLRGPLTRYKQAKCPDCRNFLYLGYDGHWNTTGHRVVADAVERHLMRYPVYDN